MTAAPRGIRNGRWHRVYYLLALFDVIAVAGGLFLTHRILTVFGGSVRENQEWVTRLERYSTLAELGTAVVAPGNDVFLDLAPDAQAERLRAAIVPFEEVLESARQDALRAMPEREQRAAADDFQQVLTAERQVVVEANSVFDHLRRHEPGLAGRRAAKMNHEYAGVTIGLNRLREEARHVQRALLEADHNEAQMLRVYQWPLGIALLCMVAAATFYGHRLSRQAHEDGRERESYIKRLQESEASLERRVDERTRELLDNERRLATSEERFQLASRATNDALWDWDIAAGSTWRNDGFRNLFGHTAPPSAGLSTTFIHPEDVERVTRGLQEFLASRGSVWTAEYRFRRHDGSTAWVLDRGFVIRDDGGSPQRMIGSMMDITERKESERLKSDFVSFVSHQLRTPLSGMSWMLELAADTQDLPAEARDYIADARESANRLVSLVNDLLDIARLESGRTGTVPAVLPLDDLTRSVLHEFQGPVADKRHVVALRADTVAPVWADPQMVRQVVANLFSNAIKYTPPGGHIAVTVEQRNGTVQWSVKDDGVGVPELAQSRLFEKFYRAANVQTMEAEGTGLGLHLVRLIVQQAGGRVWCESVEGQGALFAFTLPVAQAKGEAV